MKHCTVFTFIVTPCSLKCHLFLYYLKKKALWLNEWLVCLCVCFTQDHQYNWDDGIHRDLRSGLRPASSDKSSQAQNYKNQGRFATIKSASLVSLTNLFPQYFPFWDPKKLCALRVWGSLICGIFTLKIVLLWKPENSSCRSQHFCQCYVYTIVAGMARAQKRIFLFLSVETLLSMNVLVERWVWVLHAEEMWCGSMFEKTAVFKRPVLPLWNRLSFCCFFPSDSDLYFHLFDIYSVLALCLLLFSFGPLCSTSLFLCCLSSHSPHSFCFILLYYASHYPSRPSALSFISSSPALYNTSFSDLTQCWVEGGEILCVCVCVSSFLSPCLFLSHPPCLLSWKPALVTSK